MTYKAKRGRPTAGQAAAISDALLTAAAELFLAHGFEGVTMEAVAARAGIPRSTLYNRYSDKRTLLRAVLEARRAAWSLDASTQNWKLTAEIGQRLTHYVAWMLTWATTPEVRTFNALAASAWAEPEEAATRLEVMGFIGMVDLIESDIRQYGPASGVHARDPRGAARLLMAMIGGWLNLRSSAEPADEHETNDFARQAVDVMMRGNAAW